MLEEPKTEHRLICSASLPTSQWVTQVVVLQALFWAVMLICQMEKEEQACR